MAKPGGPLLGPEISFVVEVVGLPAGEQAWIARFNQQWKILRRISGVLESEWEGEYPSLDDAREALEDAIGDRDESASRVE